MGQRKRIPITKPLRHLVEPDDLTQILRAALQIDDRTEFLHVAVSIWHKTHSGDRLNKGGRPSLQQQAFAVCDAIWAKTPPTDRYPIPYRMIQRVKQLWLKPNGKPHADETINKHVRRWYQERRRLGEFDKDILRKNDWVLKLAIYHDTHMTLRAVSKHLDRHPLSQAFRPDVQAFREDPQTAQAFLDSLRPENDPSDPAYRPFPRK